jgi:hypothetical protein
MLRRTTGGLVDVLREILPDPSVPVLVFVDQFEELFRYGPGESDAEAPLYRDEAQAFTNLLLHAAGAVGRRIHVLVTMRSDFFGECGRYRGLAEAVSANQFLVSRMVREQLQLAITGPPCVAVGVPLERWPEVIEPALVQRIVNDAGDEMTADPLPVMQHALMRAWGAETRVTNGVFRTIRVDDYRAAGGIEHALDEHAEKVMVAAMATAGLEEPSDAVEHLFRALTEIDRGGRGIRRPQLLRELIPVVGSDPAAVQALLDAFRSRGVSFLTPFAPEEIGEATPVDISHEALIRRWRRLADRTTNPSTGRPRGWLRQEFQDGLIWRALAVQAQAFEANAEAALDPATTRERLPWFKAVRRRPAWALRYMLQSAPNIQSEQQHEWRAVRSLLVASLRRWRQSLKDARRQQREARDREAIAIRAEAIAIHAEARARRWARGGLFLTAAMVLILAGASVVSYMVGTRAINAEAAAERAQQEVQKAHAELYRALGRAIWYDLPRGSDLGVRGQNAFWQLALAPHEVKEAFLAGTADQQEAPKVLANWFAQIERALWPAGASTTEAADAVRMVLERLTAATDPYDAASLSRAVAALVGGLPPSEAVPPATRAMQIVLEQLRATDPRAAAALLDAVAALAERLPPSEATQLVTRALQIVLERLHEAAAAGQFGIGRLPQSVAALTERLPPGGVPPLAARGLEIMLESLAGKTVPDNIDSLASFVGASAGRLPPGEAAQLQVRGLRSVLEKLSTTTDPTVGSRLLRAVVALAERVPPGEAAPQAAQAMRDLLEKLSATTNSFSAASLSNAVAALAG